MSEAAVRPPGDPRLVRQATVWKHGRPAATLTRSEGSVTFEYETAYLEAGGSSVATTLPLTDEPVVTTGGAVPAFFANLLPEGRRLSALRRAIKTSADDELSLLLAAGSDPVGDVQVLAAGLDPPAEDPLQEEVSGGFEDLDFADLLGRFGIGDPAALAGVHDKVSGRMLTVPLVHGGRGHLLKFEVPEYPKVVENEAYFLSVARQLRHPVATAEVVHDREGRAGLLVSRFDRVVRDGRLRRLAVEDGAQLLGLWPADKYAVTSERLAARVGEVCAARLVALRAVLVQLTFAWLTGNGDVHAKNISVVAESEEWRVAPIYDIPSTVPYGDTTAALTLGGRRENLSRKAFLGFADGIGLPRVAAQRAIEEALATSASVIDDIAAGAVDFDHRRRQDLVRTLTRRRRDLE